MMMMMMMIMNFSRRSYLVRLFFAFIRGRSKKFPKFWKFFFDCQGIGHYYYILGSKTVNKEKYIDILLRLRDAVRKKHPEKCTTNRWFLLHDNAPAHLSVFVKHFLTKNVTAQRHTTYSPDRAVGNFYQFPRIKSALNGLRFLLMLLTSLRMRRKS